MLHSFSDAYIDYRSRWKRGNDYRIKKATDIFAIRIRWRQLN
jgi:hypothetical protein